MLSFLSELIFMAKTYKKAHIERTERWKDTFKQLCDCNHLRGLYSDHSSVAWDPKALGPSAFPLSSLTHQAETKTVEKLAGSQVAWYETGEQLWPVIGWPVLHCPLVRNGFYIFACLGENPENYELVIVNRHDMQISMLLKLYRNTAMFVVFWNRPQRVLFSFDKLVF